MRGAAICPTSALLVDSIWRPFGARRLGGPSQG